MRYKKVFNFLIPFWIDGQLIDSKKATASGVCLPANFMTGAYQEFLAFFLISLVTANFPV